MDFLAAYEEKISANAVINYNLQEQNIVAKINESLLYNKSYGKMELDFYLETFIYQNGYLNQFLLSSNGTFYGTNEFHLLVNISVYQEDEAGEYFVIGYADSRSLRYVSGCPPRLDRFVRYELYVFQTIWYAASLQILTAGK